MLHLYGASKTDGVHMLCVAWLLTSYFLIAAHYVALSKFCLLVVPDLSVATKLDIQLYTMSLLCSIRLNILSYLALLCFDFLL